MQHNSNQSGIQEQELDTATSANADFFSKNVAQLPEAEKYDVLLAFTLANPELNKIPGSDLAAQNDAVFDVNNVNDITTLSKEELIAVQEELSAQGLYTTDTNHAFYNDGSLGSNPANSVTMHGFKLLQNGEEFANAHLESALDDNRLSSTDTMKMQASLNAAGFGNGQVTGNFDAATAKSVIAYAKENDIAITDLGQGVQTALRSSMGTVQLASALDGVEGADSFMEHKEQSVFSILKDTWDNVVGVGPVADAYAKGKEILMDREGYRNDIYLDSEGYPTVGIGTLIDENHPLHGKPIGYEISDADVMKYFNEEYEQKFQAALDQAQEAGLAHDSNSIASLVSINYQLGEGWTEDFHNTWPAIVEGRYDQAIAGIKASKWDDQTPVRTADAVDWLTNVKEGATVDVYAQQDGPEKVASANNSSFDFNG